MLSEYFKDFTPSSRLQMALKDRSAGTQGSTLLNRRKISTQQQSAGYQDTHCNSRQTQSLFKQLSQNNKQSTLNILEDDSDNEENNSSKFNMSFASTCDQISSADFIMLGKKQTDQFDRLTEIRQIVEKIHQ
eukprot:403368157